VAVRGAPDDEDGAFDRGGLAFPSTHVVAAMLAAFFAGRRFFPRAAWAYALWFAAIAASTVVCGYHYPIDVAAGLVTGTVFVALASGGRLTGADTRGSYND
jgi:membrane-associated phospholipid phosphatase